VDIHRGGLNGTTEPSDGFATLLGGTVAVGMAGKNFHAKCRALMLVDAQDFVNGGGLLSMLPRVVVTLGGLAERVYSHPLVWPRPVGDSNFTCCRFIFICWLLFCILRACIWRILLKRVVGLHSCTFRK
jgi:hypothetical protein